MNKAACSFLKVVALLFASFLLTLVVMLTATHTVLADDPSVLYVKQTPSGAGDCTTWGDACSLQAALSAAAAGDEIWVASGQFTPGTARTNTFTLKNGVSLYGGFVGKETSRDERDWKANIAVLSGDIDTNDLTDLHGVVTDTANIQGENAYSVVNGGGTDDSAILDGFVVTAGQASDSHGGGMYNYYSNPTLKNVTFSGNYATIYGGGMYNHFSSPTLKDVTFIGNHAGWGGGIMNYQTSSPTLTNAKFTSNYGDEGGGLCNYFSSNPTLTNVTFYGNSASYGGGIFIYDSSVTLVNSILWDDTPEEIYNDGSANITYSIIQGGWTGMGNKDADPLFANAATGDLHLQLISPAIDAGNNSALSVGITTDLGGNPRFMDVLDIVDTGIGAPPIVDMGAFETYPFKVYLPLTIKKMP